jgi:hypothetical protein
VPLRRPRGGIVPQRGRREVKEYPLTNSDLHDLRNMGAGAVLCFSVGSVCIGIWSTIVTSMAFSSNVPKELVATWTARQTDVLIVALGMYFLGLVLVALGHTRVEEIKAEVDFGDGMIKPKRWFRVVLILVTATILVGFGFWIGGYERNR